MLDIVCRPNDSRAETSRAACGRRRAGYACRARRPSAIVKKNDAPTAEPVLRGPCLFYMALP